MVGKVKRARQKLHHAAVRPGGPEEKNEPPDPAYKDPAQESTEPLTWSKHSWGTDSNFFSSDVFATTKIDLEHVTKTLDVDSQSIVSVKKEKKTLVPKKEKAKQRRERWLQKIETLTVARQKVKAQVKRRATPVVGDMQPLVDALPELSELTTVRKPRAPRNQPRGVVKKKPEPTNYSKMRPAQKRKITEDEVSRMQELIKNPSFKANPLAAVRQHLLKRMREEQEENLS